MIGSVINRLGFVSALLLEANNNFVAASVIPIIILTDIIVVFLTVFLILKLKNQLGVYVCWVPSFISLIVAIVLLCAEEKTFGLVTLFACFLPYFISYALTTILKIRSDKLKIQKTRTEKEELARISIQDL